MKALTLWQPHATLVELGFKEVETRDWYTSYRGPLAIHSAKRFTMREKTLTDDLMLASSDLPISILTHMSFGAVLCTCTLVGCVPTALVEVKARHVLRAVDGDDRGWAPKHGWKLERLLGDYTPGRWAWLLRDVKPLRPHIVAKGHQKLWEWSGVPSPAPALPAAAASSPS